MFASCQRDKNNPAEKYADNGTRLSRNALKLVTDLSQNANAQEFNSESMKILNSSSPETYVMKSDSGSIPDWQFLNMNYAFKCLEKVFMAYELQLDSKISTNNANLGEKLLAACNALDSVSMSETLLVKNAGLKKGLSSGRYRIEGSVFQVTDMYAEVWDEFAQHYLKSQMDIQKNYENGVKNIPVSTFNTEMIKSKIDEPYSNNAVLVNLYKLRLIRDNQDKYNALKTRIDKISESFTLILQIQGEQIKRNQNKLKLHELNDALEVLLVN